MPQSPALAPPEPQTRPAPGKPRWHRRPWIVPLLIVAVAFIALRLPAYLGFGSGETLLPFQQGFPELHRALLIGHIAFGSIALITCSLQVWPWLRRHHPKAHRISGRLYVFAGVLPSGLLAVVSVIASRTPRAGSATSCSPSCGSARPPWACGPRCAASTATTAAG